jgi:transposase
VPPEHPLQAICALANAVLNGLLSQLAMQYSHIGRPSPEKLRRTLLLQVLFTIRHERLLVEQRDCNLLLRWFVGLNMDDSIGTSSTFSTNWALV